MKAQICIVNFNCGNHTAELMEDLMTQTYQNLSIKLYDQDSKDEDSIKLYNSLSNSNMVEVIYNKRNKPLNHVWNDFASSIENPNDIMLFLNNDIRISKYHVEHTVSLFERYGSSMIVHATNNARYQNSMERLSFVEETKEVKQGWEFSILKKDWTKIPESLMFYCGDDFVFHNMFVKGHKVKTITSSPVIHKLSQTRENADSTTAKEIKKHALTDIDTYKKMKYPHYWNNIPYLSRLKPEFSSIKEDTNADS